jgi:aspartyl-tRNA(Asn)/glutamyl-tRNA(Gln) amidotransferase subunit A
MARCVEDAALLLACIAGQDPMDSTTLNAAVPDYVGQIKSTHGLKGIRVGVPKEYFTEGIDPGTETCVRDALDALVDLGAELVEVSLPHVEYAIPTYYIVVPAEASSNLARYDGVRYGQRKPGADMWRTYFDSREAGFGPEVKRRIMLGTYALSAGYYDAYYNKALQVRTLLKQDFERAWQQVDVMVGPVAPAPAFKIGQNLDDPLQMYLIDIYTVSLNLVGMCGISVPCGFSGKLPVGLQVMGPVLGESVIMQVAYAYEQANDWHTQRPPIVNQ